jgi:hypothetical protein
VREGYLSNKMRRTDEAFGTPERVVKVSTMSFKFSGEAAINNSIATTFLEEISHQPRRSFNDSQFHIVNDYDQEERQKRLREMASSQYGKRNRKHQVSAVQILAINL